MLPPLPHVARGCGMSAFATPARRPCARCRRCCISDLLLEERGPKVLERVMAAKPRMAPRCSTAMAHTEEAALRVLVRHASARTSLLALHRYGALAADEGVQASALAVHAKPLPAAIVGATQLLATGAAPPWPALGTTAAWSREADVADAHTIQAEAVAGAVVRASAKLRIQRDPLTTSTSPTILARALPWAVGRGEHAKAMPAAIPWALRVPTIRSCPPLLAPASSLLRHTFSKLATVRADLILAGVWPLLAWELAPPRCTYAAARLASAMAMTIRPCLKKARATLHLTGVPREVATALALSRLLVACAMTRTKAPLAADLPGRRGGETLHCNLGRALYFLGGRECCGAIDSVTCPEPLATIQKKLKRRLRRRWTAD
mmetsp:Transcript_44135/g.93968  ORF Transcript_44135/g.93968 Transcript_44135/m.93968 type:complete len:378 (+) Transcript_44135:106-1239(+)